MTKLMTLKEKNEWLHESLNHHVQEGSHYRSLALEHITVNKWLLEQFVDANIVIDELRDLYQRNCDCGTICDNDYGNLMDGISEILKEHSRREK